MKKWEFVLYGVLVAHVTTQWWQPAWFDFSGGWIPVVMLLSCYTAVFRLATLRFLEELRSMRALFEQACAVLRHPRNAGYDDLLAKATEHDKEFSR